MRPTRTTFSLGNLGQSLYFDLKLSNMEGPLRKPFNEDIRMDDPTMSSTSNEITKVNPYNGKVLPPRLSP